MRICVLSRDNSPIGFLDNDIPDGIKYWDDTLHIYLTGTANTFTFTTTATEESVELLAVGNKLSFIYNDRPYYMNIMTTSQTEQTLEIEAWAFFLELTNEIAYDYSGTSLTFVQYFNGMIYSKEMFEIGTNEISDKKLTLEYDSDETLLARLYSLAEDFEAELEFLPELESDYSLKKVKLNVYKKHSDTDQGIGEKRTDAHYYYDKNVTGITKKLDISNLYTSVCLTGKDGLTLSDMKTTTVLDDDGNVLYAHYKGDGGFVRAPQAMQQFPAHVSGSTDKYIAYYGDTDDETVDALYKSSLEKIKEVSVPDSTYEISGVIDVNIGDTITIVDGGFSPTLILETRVTEQEISFTDSTRNSTTFENTKELESKINDTLVKRVEELAVEATAAANSSVVSSVTEYYLSTSATSQTGGSWSTTSPTWSEGTYVWTRTKTTTKGGTVSYSNAACVTGNTGAQGEQGYSVAQVTTMYYLSDSATAQSGGEWTTDMPEWKSGYYLWQKDVTLLSDGSTIMGTPALSNGINSANSTANAAKTTATNAQTTANTAKTTADTAKTTADTAKAATDTLNTLIRETTDGVEVAKVDDTGAYTGMRTEQTADAYLIKDKDGNTLASYGADTVELGKGNSKSVINMSDGNIQIATVEEGDFAKGTISFPSGYGFITVESSDSTYGQMAILANNDTMAINIHGHTAHNGYSNFYASASGNDGHIGWSAPDTSISTATLYLTDAAATGTVIYPYEISMANTITALSNGLGLDQCAFQHSYGINTATIGGSAWNNFTTTNISVTQSELQEGTFGGKCANYLILCWARVLAVSGNGGALLRLYSDGKAIHGAETKFGSGAIFTNLWQTLTFSTIWYVGEQGIYDFNAYPQILASPSYKVDSCTIMMIRLNDGFYSK